MIGIPTGKGKEGVDHDELEETTIIFRNIAKGAIYRAYTRMEIKDNPKGYYGNAHYGFVLFAPMGITNHEKRVLKDLGFIFVNKLTKSLDDIEWTVI